MDIAKCLWFHQHIHRPVCLRPEIVEFSRRLRHHHAHLTDTRVTVLTSNPFCQPLPSSASFPVLVCHPPSPPSGTHEQVIGLLPIFLRERQVRRIRRLLCDGKSTRTRCPMTTSSPEVDVTQFVLLHDCMAAKFDFIWKSWTTSVSVEWLHQENSNCEHSFLLDLLSLHFGQTEKMSAVRESRFDCNIDPCEKTERKQCLALLVIPSMTTFQDSRPT